MFPHTVTIYNVQHDFDKTTQKDSFKNYITVLRGVLLQASKMVNVQESGLKDADSVNLYIPRDVEAIDGITRKPKTYAGPMEFTRSDEKEKLWSLTLDGRGDDTFFVKGDVVEPDLPFEGIALKYDDVYNITKVDLMDFGGLQHWEVGGA